MKEDLVDWLNFHADVLGKHKFPCFVWGVYAGQLVVR